MGFGGSNFTLKTMMKNKTLRKMNSYKVLYLFMLPAILSVLVFNYKPMLGIIMAFQDFNVTKGIWGSNFAGLAHFKEFLSDPYFFSALRNTHGINGIAILVGFPLRIIFALMVFSMKDIIFKRINQTISYWRSSWATGSAPSSSTRAGR
jgi:putative aldouronate transport system permease protein